MPNLKTLKATVVSAAMFAYAQVTIHALKFLVLAACVLTPTAAFAQADAGTDVLTDTVHTVSSTAHEIRQVASNPSSPKILLVIVALVGVARLVSRIGRKLPTIRGFNLASWLDGHWWADWVLSIVVSLGGAIVSAGVAGDPVDFSLVMNAIVLGMAGAGVGPMKKPNVSNAQGAGAAAAADPGKALNS